MSDNTIPESLRSALGIWREYASDFDAMTDDEVEAERVRAQDVVDEEQGWLDAVADWIAAGRPRSRED